MARKFKKAVKQATVVRFEKIGDTAEGTLVSVKDAEFNSRDDRQGKRDGRFYTLQPDGEGKDPIGFAGTTVLDELMAQFHEGEYLRVTLTGLRPSPRFDNPLKIFQVEPAE